MTTAPRIAPTIYKLCVVIGQELSDKTICLIKLSSVLQPERLNNSYFNFCDQSVEQLIRNPTETDDTE
jgi:hypothetical protein